MPHMQVQSQAPPSFILPTPCTRLLASGEAAAGVGVATTVVMVIGAVPPAALAMEAVMDMAMSTGIVVPLTTAVPFCCRAISLNLPAVFSAVGLSAKTMPLPQCVPVRCLQ